MDQTEEKSGRIKGPVCEMTAIRVYMKGGGQHVGKKKERNCDAS